MSSSSSNSSSSTASDPLLIQCPPGKSIYYKFKNTLVMGHQGLIQSKRGRMDNVETLFEGIMILTCASRETTQKSLEISGIHESTSRGPLSVVMMTFERAQFLQYQGGKGLKKYRHLISRHDFTSKMNAHPMLFVMSPSGHIHSLVFKQSELREMRSVKKGLLRMLTTETVKMSRGQTDGFGGKYFQRFEKSHSSKHLTILQKYSKKDFMRIPLTKRRMQYEGMHVVNVSKEKHLVQSAQLIIKIHFNHRKNHPAFRHYEKISKIPNDSNHMSSESGQMAVPTKDIESLSVGHLSLQKIVDSTKVDQQVSAIVLELEKNGRGANLGSEFTFENTFGLHKDDLRHLLNSQKKHFSYKLFMRLLHAFKENPNISKESNMVLAAIVKHSRLHPIQASRILFRELKNEIHKLVKYQLSKKDKFISKKYCELLQNVLATVRSAKVQNKLVKYSTMHPYLAQNYIYASIVIAFPTEYSFKLLHTLQSKGLVPFFKRIGKNISKEENEKVKRAAFLTYSDLASRLRDVRLSEKIVKDIIQRITSNTKRDVEELTTCIHALNNAGKAVPMGVLYTYLANDKIPDSIKVMLADNLKKRLHDDPFIDQLVRDIVSSPDTSSLVKATYIHAQTEREKTLRTASHVKYFSKIHERTSCEETKNAIRRYLYTVGTEESGDALSKALKLSTKQNSSSRKKNEHSNNSEDEDIHMDGEILDLLNEEEHAQTLGRFRSRFFRNIFHRVRSAVAKLRSIRRHIHKHFHHSIRKHFVRVGKRVIRMIGRKLFKSIGRFIRRVKRLRSRHKPSQRQRKKCDLKCFLIKLGKGIKRGIVKLGRSLQKAAKKVGRVVKVFVKFAKQIVHSAKEMVETAKKIKLAFSKPTNFKRERVCVDVNVKHEKICTADPSMLNFIRKQGALNKIRKSKGFLYETVQGYSPSHVYAGLMIYSGATFECGDVSKFDFVLLARVSINAVFGGQEFSVFEGRGEFTKRPNQPVHDNLFFKMFFVTIYNEGLMPNDIKDKEDACFTSPSHNLFQKQAAEPKIPIQVFAGPVPLSFAFYATITVGVDLSYGLCPNRISASVSLEPFVAISLGGRAGIGVAALSAGVFVEATITYKFIPRIAIENCNVCIMLLHGLEPLEFKGGLFVALPQQTVKLPLPSIKINATKFRKKLAQICIPIEGNAHGKPIFKLLPSSRSESRKNISLPRNRQIAFHPHEGGSYQHDQNNKKRGRRKTQYFKRPSAPKGFRLPSSKLAQIWKHLPVMSARKLQKFARKDGHKMWAKTITKYRNQFGPGAQKIKAPSFKKPSKQSLAPPVLTPQQQAWSTQFLKKHVPRTVIQKLGFEKLRHVPKEYFAIKKQDRRKIPYQFLQMPSHELKAFIADLPKTFMKKKPLVISRRDQTKIWSKEELNKRLTSDVVKNVELKYLRHLPEPILRIRKPIISKIPYYVFKKGTREIVSWVCEHYYRLCKKLVDDLLDTDNLDFTFMIQKFKKIKRHVKITNHSNSTIKKKKLVSKNKNANRMKSYKLKPVTQGKRRIGSRHRKAEIRQRMKTIDKRIMQQVIQKGSSFNERKDQTYRTSQAPSQQKFNPKATTPIHVKSESMTISISIPKDLKFNTTPPNIHLEHAMPIKIDPPIIEPKEQQKRMIEKETHIVDRGQEIDELFSKK